tara:strand:- start:72 stop:317 length:246 start_codon:yes stop_codon:yes gene_type:complete
MKINVIVKLKKDVLDPQGLAIKNALTNLDFKNLNSVRQGKIFEIQIEENDKDKAFNQVEEMCKSLLTNSNVENYKINFDEE